MAVTIVAPSATQWVVARLILARSGLAGVGSYAAVMAIAGLAGVVADLNVTPRMMRGISHASTGQERARWHAAAGLVWMATSTVVVGVVAAAGLLGRGALIDLPATTVVVAAATGCLLMLTQMCALRVAAEGSVARQAVIAAVNATSLVWAVALYVRDGSVSSVASAALVSSVVSAVVAWRIGFGVGLARVGPLLPMVSSLTRSGLHMTLAAMTGAGALLAQPLLIRAIAGEAELGIFRIGGFLSTATIGMALLLVSRAFLPRLLAAERDGAHHQLGPFVGAIALAMAGAGCVSMMVGSTVVSWALDVPAARISGLVPILALGDAIRVGGVLMTTCLVATGRERTFVALEAGFGVVFLGATAVGVSQWGTVGAAVAYAVSYGAYGLAAFALVARAGPRARVQMFRGLIVPGLVVAAVSLAVVATARPVSLLVGATGLLILGARAASHRRPR